MDAGQYPRFANLYNAYFHEDWSLDDATGDDVVRRYMACQPAYEVEELRVEMAGLLATDQTEAELNRTLGPWTFFRPTDEASSIREWIEHLLRILEGGPA